MCRGWAAVGWASPWYSACTQAAGVGSCLPSPGTWLCLACDFPASGQHGLSLQGTMYKQSRALGQRGCLAWLTEATLLQGPPSASVAQLCLSRARRAAPTPPLPPWAGHARLEALQEEVLDRPFLRPCPLGPGSGTAPRLEKGWVRWRGPERGGSAGPTGLGKESGRSHWTGLEGQLGTQAASWRHERG